MKPRASGADLGRVTDAHLFAPYVPDLLQAPGQQSTGGVGVPPPDGPLDIPQPVPAGIADVARVEASLTDRMEYSLKAYSAGVVEREQMSAEVASEVQRERLRPELDAQLESIAAKRDDRVFQVRKNAAPRLSKLRTDLALLEARIRTSPGEIPGDLMARRAEMRSEIAAQESSIESEIQSLRKEADAARKQATREWEARMEQLEARQRELARDRARLQIEQKTSQSGEALKLFVSRLRSLRQSSGGARAAGPRAVGVSGAGFDDAARVFRQSAAEIRRKMADDARMAADLTGETQSKPDRNQSTARASRLVGAR